ncbi:hypothetical protein ABID16_001252 [Rhizobium aquaticum]|uniref:Membrane protein 6-pyruvoyl-tetrahydropterin synthase-related domain-containing protein n=1 Tax=Rhizobium aquaticum TaxID=1549636 RepID=A0ABV2IWS9_9HYPH
MSSSKHPSLRRASLHAAYVSGTIALTSILLLRFHFIYGYPVGDSTQYNVPWSVAFSQQFWSGDWYPRWLFAFPANIGGPVFYFYGPLPFYALAFISALAPGLSPTETLTVFHGLLYGFSGLAFYVWARRHASSGASLLGACLYMGAPYHFIDIEHRNAIGEAMAFILVPLIFRYLLDVEMQGRRWLRASLLYAALIISHLPSALLTTPFMILSTAIVYRDAPVRGLIRLGVTGCCGLLLAGIYLAPALALRDWLPSDAWLTDANSWPETWLLPGGFFFRAGGLFFGAILSLVALAGCLQLGLWMAHRHRKREDRARPVVVAAWVGLAVSIVMFSEASVWLWTHVGPLRNVQFPFRLGVITDFLSVTIIVCALQRLLEMAHRAVSAVWVGATVAVVFMATTGLMSVPDFAAVYLGRLPQVDEKPLECCVQASEYWMGSVLHSPLFASLKTRKAYQAAVGAFPALDPRRALTQDEALEGRQVAGRLVIEARLSAPAEVRIGQAYLPEWRLAANGSAEAVPLRSDPDTGLTLAELPAGSHQFALFIPETEAEWWGKWASVAGLLLTFAAALMFREEPITATSEARAGS